MRGVEVILGLLIAVVVVVSIARRVAVPYPIMLVLGGLALGFVPGLPHVEIEPELVFVFFLPPLIQSAAYVTSIRDLRANVRSLILLAVGLVLFTTAVVAVVAHWVIPGLPWAAAFVLGAIVSPPDPVAITAVGRQLHLPKRLTIVLEGEGLINDAVALVAYQLAVAAVVTGAFSIQEAGLRFLFTGGGGVVLGLLIGWGITRLIHHLNDPVIEITISLLSSFGTYLLADYLSVSGILAVVTIGLYLGQRSSHIMSSETRLMAVAVWDMVVFLLNGLVFILIGLQLQTIFGGLTQYSYASLFFYAVAVSLAVIIARIVWVFPAIYLPRMLFRRIRERDPLPPRRQVVVAAWAGMRGVISLAAALALPFVVSGGAPFPERRLIVFLSFSVILVTLVLQGLSLPPLIRLLGVGGESTRREEASARLQAAQAAVSRLKGLADEDWASPAALDDLRSHYRARMGLYEERLNESENSLKYEELSSSYKRMQQEVLNAERQAILDMRGGSEISEEVLRQVERDLDLEEQRLQG